MAYVQAVGCKALIQAVARIMEPGCKADCALILEGPQGALKSSTIRVLAKEEAWFADEISDLGSKDAAQDLRGKWIVEFAELSAMKRSEIERTKAFMSRSVDHYRPSYGRRSQDFPRQCVFFGTTNADAYLLDDTNRRSWGVRVGTIKLNELRKDVDQLWAEAVAAYRAGEKWWLDADTERAAAEAQSERRIADVWEDTVLEWAGRAASPFTSSEVLLGAVKVAIEKQDRAAEMRVSAILKRNGWIRKRASTGSRSWGYVREVGTGSEEVGTDADERKVGTVEVGWDEVGTSKAQHYQGSSQPSQPISRTCRDGDREQDRDTYSPRSTGLEKGLGRWDGWDGSPPTSNPNACIYCGEHCSPTDMGNSIRGEDGRWHHLDCEPVGS